MAKIDKNILGNLSGKVGNLVFVQRKGKTHVKSVSTRRRSAMTPAQQQQQAKFKLVFNFVATMKDLVRISFSKYAKTMTEFNYATSINYRHALKEENGQFVLDYSSVRISGGSLRRASEAVSLSLVAGTIDFGWRNNSEFYNASPGDRAILVAHCADLNETVFTVSDAIRAESFGALKVPGFEGKEVHTWIAFISDRKIVSDNVYTGLLTVRNYY